MDTPLGIDPDGNGPLEDRSNGKSKIAIPLPDSMAWFRDEITTFAQGDRYLMAAVGGCGKSLFMTQFGIALAASEKVAFILTEEPEATQRARIKTMLGDREPAEVTRINANILIEDGLSTTDLLPEMVASQILRPGGAFHGVRIVFIDSLMGAGMPATPGRRWERIINALKTCQKAGITTFSSAHINKTGTMAGPMSLRHAADCCMFMRQLGNHRILTVTKNRNGIADQRQPARLVIDPATLMLKPAPHAEPVAVSARSYVSGAGEVEIQSTIGLTLGNRRRIVSGSIPHGEIQQLLDMISDIRGIDINDTDFAVSTRTPGARIYSPTMALSLCMTLIGSALQEPVNERYLFLGEIDLKRRIRDVPDLLATEVANAVVAGAIRRPVTIVCSPGTASVIATNVNAPCAACRTIDEVVFLAFPQTR